MLKWLIIGAILLFLFGVFAIFILLPLAILVIAVALIFFFFGFVYKTAKRAFKAGENMIKEESKKGKRK